MRIAVSDMIVGGLVTVFGLLGLLLGARALDEEMYVFGLSLFVFACLFVIGQIRRHYNTAEAVAREAGHG